MKTRNIFICKRCGGQIVTEDRAPGLIPTTILCRATDGCLGLMQSQYYPERAQEMAAGWAWMHPEDLAGIDPELYAHIRNGGLALVKLEAQA